MKPFLREAVKGLFVEGYVYDCRNMWPFKITVATP
jgi:hypothetical protein